MQAADSYGGRHRDEIGGLGCGGKFYAVGIDDGGRQRLAVEGDGCLADVRISQAQWLPLEAADGGGHQGAFVPYFTDLETSHGAQAADAALRPDGRQGGQELEGIGVALQQHLCHAGTDAEVAVDLEGCVGVEEVVVDAALGLVDGIAGAVLELQFEEFHTLLGLQGACPEVDLPAHGPPCGRQSAQHQAAHGWFAKG